MERALYFFFDLFCVCAVVLSVLIPRFYRISAQEKMLPFLF